MRTIGTCLLIVFLLALGFLIWWHIDRREHAFDECAKRGMTAVQEGRSWHYYCARAEDRL